MHCRALMTHGLPDVLARGLLPVAPPTLPLRSVQVP